MTHEYEFAPKVKLEIRRCYDCHLWYGAETSTPQSDHTCPHCARAHVARLNQQISKMEKTVNALRGAITKLKGKRR